MLIQAITRSGVTDCACCGMAIMTSDISKPSRCDGCPPGGECDPGMSWHCPTGECDGTVCDENGGH